MPALSGVEGVNEEWRMVNIDSDMKLFEVMDPSVWDAFQIAQPWSQFTQSWIWGDFLKSQGREVRRYALRDDADALLATIQLEFRRKPIVGGFWFASRGPVIAASARERSAEIHVSLTTELKRVLPPSLFWRWEPFVIARSSGDEAIFEKKNKSNWCRSKAANPRVTSRMNLSQSPEKLLANMHPKTRYNIRVAERHGVTVRVSRTEEDLSRFLLLMDETAERDQFAQHERQYLEVMCRFLFEQKMGCLRIAEHGNQPLAMSLEISYGDTVTYFHGASSSQERQRMAPFALHWRAICEAKQAGSTYYDWWGINPSLATDRDYKKSWEGITRFKQGWGGEVIELSGTWDLPMRPWLYALVTLQQKFRR